MSELAPCVFYVCGGIGAGKSTVIRHLTDCGLACALEPVDAWQRAGMLDAMYKTQELAPGAPRDPAVHIDAAAFQTAALVTRYAALQASIGGAGPTGAVCVERSLAEDREVFAAETIPAGSVTRAAYDLAWDTLTAQVMPHVAYHIVLDCPVATMMERAAGRGRTEEAGLSAGYMHRLGARYASWADKLPPARTFRVDASVQAEHVAVQVAEWVLRLCREREAARRAE